MPQITRTIPPDLDPVGAQILINLAASGYLDRTTTDATLEAGNVTRVNAEYDAWLAARPLAAAPATLPPPRLQFVDPGPQ